MDDDGFFCASVNVRCSSVRSATQILIDRSRHMSGTGSRSFHCLHRGRALVRGYPDPTWRGSSGTRWYWLNRCERKVPAGRLHAQYNVG